MPKRPLTILIAANVVAVAATILFVRLYGNHTVGLLALPIVVTGLRLGQRAGIMASILNVSAGVVIITFASQLDAPGEITFRVLTGITLGVVAGRFGDMRKRMEIVQRESESVLQAYTDTRGRFENLADTATDGILSVDESGTITYANPAVQRILLHDPDSLVGQPLTTLIPENLRSSHASGFHRYLSSGERRLDWSSIEVPGLRADGETVPLELSFGEYRRGDTRFFTGIFRDATERRRARAELERLLASKDELVASVSHELRTPLTAVVGFAREIEQRHKELDPETLSELISTVADQAEDLANIVEDLLAAARAESGQLTVRSEPVDLMAEVKRVVGEGVKRFDGSEFNPTVEGSAVIARADSGRVRQILRNLLTNAARYGAEPVMVEVESSGTVATVIVADTGPGIDDQEQDRVFEPYYRVDSEKSQPRAVGLGLSVARRLARLMDGDLTYGRSGGQSQFQLTLPLNTN